MPIVLAMGIQNEAVHRAGEVKPNVTYVTGTLVSLGEKFADAFRASEPHERWGWVPYLLLWTGLVIGAGIGARIYGDHGLTALLWPAAVLVLFAAITAGMVWFGRGQEKPSE